MSQDRATLEARVRNARRGLQDGDASVTLNDLPDLLVEVEAWLSGEDGRCAEAVRRELHAMGLEAKVIAGSTEYFETLFTPREDGDSSADFVREVWRSVVTWIEKCRGPEPQAAYMTEFTRAMNEGIDEATRSVPPRCTATEAVELLGVRLGEKDVEDTYICFADCVLCNKPGSPVTRLTETDIEALCRRHAEGLRELGS